MNHKTIRLTSTAALTIVLGAGACAQATAVPDHAVAMSLQAVLNQSAADNMASRTDNLAGWTTYQRRLLAELLAVIPGITQAELVAALTVDHPGGSRELTNLLEENLRTITSETQPPQADLATWSTQERAALAALAAQIPEATEQDMANAVALALRSNAQNRVAVLHDMTATIAAEASAATQEPAVSQELVPTFPHHDPGTMFYTGAKSAGFLNTGHVGMYIFDQWVSETSPEKGVYGVKVYDHQLPKGSQYLDIHHQYRTQADKNRAAAFAVSMEGKPYNWAAPINKRVFDFRYNCAQLIWAAYVSATEDRIHLDTSRTSQMVTPRELRDHPWIFSFDRA